MSALLFLYREVLVSPLPWLDELERAQATGYGEVELPDAPARKYPRACYDWGWKFVFPSTRLSTDPRTGAIRCHSFATHLPEAGYDIRAGKGVTSPLDRPS